MITFNCANLKMDKLNSHWQFGNKVLYDMCENNPKHNNEDIIVGKLWIIGRTYAAAIERRKNTKEVDSGDDFYFNVVAPSMMEIGDTLDAMISSLSVYDCIDENNIGQIISVHNLLTVIFNEISGLDKRSLASKYLHFHLPNLFYIYDSRADNAIRKMVKNDQAISQFRQRYLSYEHDKTYFDFFFKAYFLDKHIESKIGYRLTPREIDSLLLNY